MKKQRYKTTCSLKVSTTVQGAIGENKVASLLLENGYNVNKPVCDTGIDLVVGKPKNLNTRIKDWKSIQVKFHTRCSETTFGKSLRVKITPNYCDYIAIPVEKGLFDDKEHIIFYPQEKKMMGKEHVRLFAIYDNKLDNKGNYKNQHNRRDANNFFKLPK